MVPAPSRLAASRANTRCRRIAAPWSVPFVPLRQAVRRAWSRRRGRPSALAVWCATGRAQSPTPFGIPTPARPQPAADIDAVPGSRAQGWLAQGRSEVLARHGIVATSDPLAAQAGLEILRQGGNAIDAAVATGAVLDVTSQNDTGIGGDLFALVYVAKDKKLYALNSAGWAPAGWTPEFFTQTLGVTGGARQRRERGDGARRDLRLRRAAQALRHDDLQGDVRARGAHRRGRLGTGRAPARRSAQRVPTPLRADPDSAATFLSGGEAPALYSIIRNPGLAKALRLIQQQGRDAFYKGDIAAAIVAKVQANGGVMTRGRPRRVPVGVGRADLDELPRLRRLRAAAARPGLRRARDAEHPRGVRAEARA